MKVGDVVVSKNVKSNEAAVVIRADISNRLKDNGKKETRTKYVARYEDGSLLTFIGSCINKTIFLVPKQTGQMELDEYIEQVED